MYETTCEVFQFGKKFWLRFTSGPEAGTIKWSGFTTDWGNLHDVVRTLRSVIDNVTFVESRAGQFQA